MELWKIMTICGTVCLLIPFFVWQVTRWRERVKQHFAVWHKPVVISAFGGFFLCAIMFFLLAFFL